MHSMDSLTLSALKKKRVHFIGLGGAGMSGIARIMIDHGIAVSGSDVKDSPILHALSALGAEIFIGHNAVNIQKADLVVASSAIRESNPEMKAAQVRSLPIIPRAQALAILMSDSISVAVAGTHGKTTTTSMLTVALQHAGLDPSFAIGGMINSSGANAHRGSGQFFIAEADESDGSFLVYKPNIAIITNLELDHVDHFKTFSDIFELFQAFVSSIKPNGYLIACSDDSGVRQLLTTIDRQDLTVITYGNSGTYQINNENLQPMGSRVELFLEQAKVGQLSLSVPGHHNVLNALAAFAAGITLGVAADDLIGGLNQFTGTRRRFEIKGQVGGITIIDDYGHHPTEITATLKAARGYAGEGKVLVIFQPHRYSRTAAFAREFAHSLDQADSVYVLEIYPASEDPIPGVSSALITKYMENPLHEVIPSMIEIVERVSEDARAGDVILTLGAGDVSALGQVLLDNLANK